MPAAALWTPPMTEPGLHQTAVFDNPSAEEGSLVQSVGVEEMARALCAYTIRTRRKWDTPSDKIEAMIAKGDVVDFAWRDYVGEAEVAVALFAPILAEKERQLASFRQYVAMQRHRAEAAEAALAGERERKTVDGSIDIRLDEQGKIDEIFGNGVLCHIERMDKGHWFVSMTRPDQTSEAFWLTGKGKVEFTHHEHRQAPTVGPNVEPWTIAAAIRAQE